MKMRYIPVIAAISCARAAREAGRSTSAKSSLIGWMTYIVTETWFIINVFLFAAFPSTQFRYCSCRVVARRDGMDGLTFTNELNCVKFAIETDLSNHAQRIIFDKLFYITLRQFSICSMTPLPPFKMIRLD